MKRYFLTLLLILLSFKVVTAQFIVKATPFVLLKNQIVNLNAELSLPSDPRFSLNFGIAKNLIIKGNLQGNTPNLEIDLAKSSSGFALEPGIREYIMPTKTQYEGLYLGLFSSFRFSHAYYYETVTVNNNLMRTAGTIDQNNLVAVMGLELGYQFFLGAQKNIAIDIYAGIGAKNTSYKLNSKNLLYTNVSSSNTTGIATRGNISLGYLID
jgi:hypothetical protein